MSVSSDDDKSLFDVSEAEQMSDIDLMERHRQLAHIERARFHEGLSATSFIGHSSHILNSDVLDARWAVEREMKRRGMRPPREENV